MIGFFIILFGLAIGSFLNVVISRLGGKTPFWHGRSRCPLCGHEIAWYDNIPLLSFLSLRGRCRYCQKPISLQYPLVELTTAILFYGLYSQHGVSIEWLALALFTSILIVIFVYDLKTYLIPDGITLPAIVIAAAVNWYLGLGLMNLLIGAVIGGGFFALQYVVSRGQWVGDGDIRLGVLMGLMLGWQELLVALLIAYFVGAIIGLILIGGKKKTMSSAVPFGPFLAAATIVTFFFGQRLLEWYLNLLY